MVPAFKRKRWRDAQRLRIDLNGMMAPPVADAGVREADLEALVPSLLTVQETLERQRRAGALGFAALPGARADLKRTLALAERVRGHYDDLVVLAGGESALAVRAIAAALAPRPVGAAPAEGAMRLHVADTIDPATFGALLGGLDARRTLFNVIGAPAETAATVSQFLVVRDRLLRELGAVEYAQHIVVTTHEGDGALRQIVHDEGFRHLVVPANVGGCCTALAASGVFPTCCAGVDVVELLAGAADMAARTAEPDPRANPALLHAGVLHLAAMRSGRRLVLLVPYAEALAGVAEWCAALWAGVRTDAEAAAVAWEFRPVPPRARALAIPDEGGGALALFLRVEEHAGEITVPQGYDDLEAVGYLGGLGLGELTNLEQQSAEAALARHGGLSSTVVCPRMSPFVVGQLIYLLEAESAVLAALSAGDTTAAVPAAECEQLTEGIAGRPGYEGKRAEVQRWLARKEARYVV